MQITVTVSLVTGAKRGIGGAFADALLARGARKVYAAVRNVASMPPSRLVPWKKKKKKKKKARQIDHVADRYQQRSLR